MRESMARWWGYVRVRFAGRQFCRNCDGPILERVGGDYCSVACGNQFSDDMAW